MKVVFDNDGDYQESLFSDLKQRLRNIEASPAGEFILTDGPGGKLIKVLKNNENSKISICSAISSIIYSNARNTHNIYFKSNLVSSVEMPVTIFSF